jgi:hypothetical protein
MTAPSPFQRFFATFLASASCLTVALAFAPADASGHEPWSLFLTWKDDPSRSMVVDWHLLAEDAGRPSALEYRRSGGDAWETAETQRLAFPFSDRVFDRAELSGLEPGTEYEFRAGEGSAVYRFQTMPERLEEPLRFAIGGDVRHEQEWMEQTNRAAMAHDPAFIVWGGDLAYADGREDRVDRWYEWFDAIKNTLIDERGRVVPIVVGIGNHEVRGGYYGGGGRGDESYEDSDAYRESIAPYFYTFFAFPGHPGYAALDFGDYLSLLMLDTDHSGPVAGRQTEWLAAELAKREGRARVFPVYHVPAYPSVRDYDGKVSAAVREHWVPLFEAQGVRYAFEQHDHAYKRSVPIRAGKENSDGGIVYFGDGSWGVGVREVHDPETTWYLEKAQTIRHALIVTLDGDETAFLAIDSEGGVIDEYPPR